MNEQQQQSTQSYMSVFVPYIANYTREDLRRIIEQMNIGTISRIDISTRRNQPSNMAFLHFREWNDENPLTEKVKYEMETYEQYSIDVPLDIKNPDLSPDNYFTLNLRINKNPIPPASMTLETLSDGLMRTLDLVETLQKKCDTLTLLGNQQNEIIDQLTDRILYIEDENAQLKQQLQESIQNVTSRLFRIEPTVSRLLQIDFERGIQDNKELSKLELKRQTNAPPQFEKFYPIPSPITRSYHNFDDLDIDVAFDPNKVNLGEITIPTENQDFDPFINGEEYWLHCHNDGLHPYSD